MATSSPAAIALHQLEVAAAHGFASKCLSIAGICILIYDHILTFPDEVRFIWKQKWSIVSTIFVLNRYITPLVLAVDVYDKGGLANFLPKSLFQIEFEDTVEYNPFFRICFAQLSPHIWMCWLPALIFETFLFVMTLIKAREHSKSNFNTPMLHILYRDGILYYVVICCCSIFNMTVWLVAPPTLIALSKFFVLAVVPAMGARLVLNLRSSRREDVMPTGGRSTAEDAAVYEMRAKGGQSKPLRGERFVFASIQVEETFDEEEERHLSTQERTYFDQTESSRVGTKGVWSLV
ncbi:hypothetical protein FRC07_009159 [Ceratobasidium sp. 392]|nr:hypothetical protein FRC07_009159 [Ceratobasidium sp. 392]